MDAAPLVRKKKATPRRHKQRPIAVPDPTWEKALRIARNRNERDNIGDGVPVVVRRALAEYVLRYAADDDVAEARAS